MLFLTPFDFKSESGKKRVKKKRGEDSFMEKE
jgi:hypothetical protein